MEPPYPAYHHGTHIIRDIYGSDVYRSLTRYIGKGDGVMDITECLDASKFCILCDKIKNDHYKQIVLEVKKKNCSIFLCNQCLMELASKLVPIYEYDKQMKRIEKLANKMDKQIRREEKCLG